MFYETVNINFTIDEYVSTDLYSINDNYSNGNYKINYYVDNNLLKTQYLKDGKLHRQDGPAMIEYKKNSKYKSSEIYCINGTVHRDDGPAAIYYYNSEVKHFLYIEIYYILGKPHNLKGPARIYYDENGNVEREQYFINGERIKFQKNIDNLNNDDIIKIINELTDDRFLLVFKLLLNKKNIFNFDDIIDSAIVTLKILN